jgi:hypothetical protein
VNFVTRLLRRLRPSSDPEEEAETQRLRAEHKNARERQLALSGPRGIGGLPPESDDTKPR